ncbi:uncharacterized protein LOC144622710 [Crassostrea virginica]
MASDKIPKTYSKTTWTHKFCRLGGPNEDEVPDKPMKRILIEAGLGEKKLVLVKNKDAEYLRDALLEYYPKLKDGGGYELMRSSSRTLLETISIPSYGYTTHYLSDESDLGSAICYIRPLQAQLSLDAEERSEVC